MTIDASGVSASVWHSLAEERPDVAEAVVVGGAVFAWYAMPDVVRSSLVRFVGKTAILGGVVCYYAHLPGVTDAIRELPEAARRSLDDAGLSDLPTGVKVGALAVTGVATLALNSAVERFILHRGERRKASGKRLPHVRQGLVLGAIAGGLTYLSAHK